MRRHTLILNPAQIEAFHEHGFLALEAVSTSEEIALLRMILDRLLMTRAGFKEGAQFDLLRGDEGATENNLLQIMNPVNYAPQLRDTLFRANALAIAQQLLGEQATPFFEHAIFKPARRGAATPWHQDEAYRPDPDYVYRELSIWMPLQDVSVENGCMHFVPGTNRGDVLTHRSPNNDPNMHALECCGDFDPTKAVACPLRSSGCTVHDGRTLHYAGPNRTDIPRWAYILAFDLPPKPRAGTRRFGWNEEKHSADMARKRVWLVRGGLFVQAWRMLRNGVLNNPSRMKYLMRRAWQTLVKSRVARTAQTDVAGQERGS